MNEFLKEYKKLASVINMHDDPRHIPGGPKLDVPFPRKRALLDDDQAREIFMLRELQHVPGRELSSIQSFFTARSFIVSKV